MNTTLIKYISVTLLGITLAIALLLGATSADKRRYDRQNNLLTKIERSNAGINLTMVDLLAHPHDDFDGITAWQSALVESVDTMLAEKSSNKNLAKILTNQNQSIDDFKSAYAIYRNSVRSFERLLSLLRQSQPFLALDSQLISKVTILEKNMLKHIFLKDDMVYRKNPQISLANLEQHPQYENLKKLDHWKYLRLHIEKLLYLVPNLEKLSNDILNMPVEANIDKLRFLNEYEFAKQLNRAKIYQVALFIYLLVLVGIVIQKVVQVKKYVSLIESSKETLEKNVVQRTTELAETNALLKLEMQEAEKMQKALAQSQKLESIGQLAAGIAHEINTPMQYVGDNTDFLKSGFESIRPLLETLTRLKNSDSGSLSKEDLTEAAEEADINYLIEEIPQALAGSIDGIERVTNIVSAMKNFSHPSQEKTAIDLNEAINSTITVASNEWKYCADMEMDLDQKLPFVTCVPGEFNQVVLNMIVNASHAITDVANAKDQEKGMISIKTCQVDNWAEVHIADTGSGMSEDVRERIFDPFFTTKQVGKGTGQGLSIAYDVIVNKHDGSINVESQPGRGTEFTIRLPLAG